MAERPQLKLKLSSKAPKPDVPQTPTPASASTKIKLKFNPSQTASSTPTEPPPKPATKSGRKPKATPKKRAIEEAEIESDSEPLANAVAGSSASKPRTKKAKLLLKAKPEVKPVKQHTNLKFKYKGQLPDRPLGVGYDSEEDDRELDPTIDSDFVLRMQPGEDCEYLRRAIEENTFGKNNNDIGIKFLTNNSRRADVVIRGHHYAAILVDMPCVIEAMKSWNKRDFYKSADVCQMLLVLGRCKTEEEAAKFPLPTQKGDFDQKTWQWAHGITPPMRWARKRKFRKRLSTKVVEEDEQEVERLLQADDECITSKYRHIYPEDLDRENSAAFQESDEDAEGEVDEGIVETTETQTLPLDEGEDDEDLEAHFEREMAKAAEESEPSFEAANNPTSTTITPAGVVTESPAATPGSTSAAIVATPPAGAVSSTEENNQDSDEDEDEDEDDDDDDDDDEDEDGDSAVDDDLLEQQQDKQRQQEEISDLEAAILREEQRLATTTNGILRQKIGRTILALRSDLEVKKGGSGGGDREDDG